MKRALFALLLTSGLCRGQQTVIQTVLNAVTTATASAPIQNIGQSSHQATIFVTATGGSGTCSGFVQLEFSYNGSLWVPFSGANYISIFNSPLGVQNYGISGSGVYPYVRVNLASLGGLGGASCSATAYYSAGPAGSSPFTTVGQASVFVKALNAVTAAPTNSQTLPSVGQGSHAVTLYVTNTSGTCTGSASLQYSYDNATYTPFQQANSTVAFAVGTPGTQAYVVSGNGTYPFVIFSLLTFAGGSCTATAWYSGSPAASGPVTTVGQATVQQKILNGVSGPGASQAVQNVGQGSHQVTLFVTNVSGTCSGSGQLEYSFDNSTWTVFNAQQAVIPFSVSAAGTQTFNINGNSVFPYIRFNLTAFAGGSCTATAWYSGAPGGSEPVKTVGQATVFLQPFNAYSGAPPSVTLTNNGQFFHQVTTQLGNAPGHTCSAATDGWQVTLAGSVNGNDSTHNILTVPNLVGGQAHGPFFGQGAYATLTLFASPLGAGQTNCSLSAWYAGGTSGNLAAVTSANGGVGGVLATPINQCGFSTNITVSAGSTSSLTSAFLVGGIGIRVCALVLTTATASTTATLKTSTAGTACASGLTTVGTFLMGIGQTVSIGSGLGSFLVVGPFLDVCLQATTGNIDGFLSYDFQ